MILGFALIAAGIGLAFLWPQEFFFAVKSALILGLMLIGSIHALIAISRRKAKRGFAAALQDGLGEENTNNAAPTADSSNDASTPPI